MAQLDKIRLSGTTYDIIDATAIHSLDGYYTTGETNAAITAATNALAESIAEQGYQTSGDVQNAISGKVDTTTYTAYTAATDAVLTGKADTTAVTESINEATSGKVDVTTYTAYTAATDTVLSGKADISDIPSVSGYADSVQYNTSSKYVEFYHGGTGGTKVYEFDASPFLIDGMVESVVITSITSGGSEVTVLEITWNIAAGGQVTDIPLTDIFDASNYYTKTQVDTALANKADLSAATVTVHEAGTVNSTSPLQLTLSFDYADGVYYFSGDSSYLDSNIRSLEIKYSDGTTETTVGKTQTGDTENYNFVLQGRNIIFQTKGSNKITSVYIYLDDFDSISYTYMYSRDTEVAVSTYIENTILPSLSGKADTTAVTQSISEAVSGKADTTAVTQSITEATSGKVDSSTYTAYTAATDTALAGKQATLVNQENIKSINGNSLLGSGDLTVDTGLHAEVSGTTLIFS